MHILIIPSEHFITQTQPLSGIFQYHQAKALSNAGYQIGILSVGYISPRYLFTHYNYKKKEKNENINIMRAYKRLYFPHRYISFNLLKKRYIKMADSLYKKYIKEFGKPDIIHAHNFLYAGQIANWLNQKYEIPYFITEHSSTLLSHEISTNKLHAMKAVANNALAITAVSSSFRYVLQQLIKTDVNVLPNVIDSFFFEQALESNQNEIFTFLTIGSLDKNKNQEILIKAFAAIAKKNHNVLLKIGGDGDMLNTLNNLVHQYGLQQQVIMLGKLTQHQVRHEMINSTCFVLSSKQETFGVVLIEALACGLPLIATKCGGPEDIVNDSNGILIDTGNQLQLENAMLYMCENAHLYKKQKLRHDANEIFGERAFIKNVMKYYELGSNNAN